MWTGLLCHRGISNLLDEELLIVVFFLRQGKNLTKLVDRKIVSVRQSIGMGRISRRNNRRPKLELSPQSQLQREERDNN
ncbi:MAG: hypothetical protein M3227_08635 [Thermoproteota archaeon]|nr:hypothetical protein [Thermoproteota archaeon]